MNQTNNQFYWHFDGMTNGYWLLFITNECSFKLIPLHFRHIFSSLLQKFLQPQIREQKAWIHSHEPDAPFVMASIRWANATDSKTCPLLTVEFWLRPMNCAQIAWETAFLASQNAHLTSVHGANNLTTVCCVKSRKNQNERKHTWPSHGVEKTDNNHNSHNHNWIQFSKSKSIQMLG